MLGLAKGLMRPKYSNVAEITSTERTRHRIGTTLTDAQMVVVKPGKRKRRAARATAQRGPFVNDGVMVYLATCRGKKLAAFTARKSRLGMLNKCVMKHRGFLGEAFAAMSAVVRLVVVLFAVQEKRAFRWKRFAADATVKTMTRKHVLTKSELISESGFAANVAIVEDAYFVNGFHMLCVVH